jgi:hypothetical protein
MAAARLLSPTATAAIVFGAHDWTEAGLGVSPSFRQSAKGVSQFLTDSEGLGLDPALVLDLFDSRETASEQLSEIKETLDKLLQERRTHGQPVTDLLVYYVGHGQTDDQGHLSLLVRRSRRGIEVETGIRAPDLARVLKIAAPQQRRVIVLDCCFSEAAARGFLGMASLDQAFAAIAAKDLDDATPQRGTLLLCSSPLREVSMASANAQRTLFTGAILDVLRGGSAGGPSLLSMADLRDAAYQVMLETFGANAPRPVIHQTNATYGDLTRIPAFRNRFLNVSDASPLTPGMPLGERLAVALNAPALPPNLSQTTDKKHSFKSAVGDRKILAIFGLILGTFTIAATAIALMQRQGSTKYTYATLPHLPCDQLKRLPGMEWRIACNDRTAVGYYWEVKQKNINGTYGYYGLASIPDTVSTCISEKDIGKRGLVGAWWMDDSAQGFNNVNFQVCRKKSANEDCDNYDQGREFEGVAAKNCDNSDHCGVFDVVCRRTPT